MLGLVPDAVGKKYTYVDTGGHIICEQTHGCFHELGVLFLGVLITTSFLRGVYIRALDFCKLPHSNKQPLTPTKGAVLKSRSPCDVMMEPFLAWASGLADSYKKPQSQNPHRTAMLEVKCP